MTNKTNDTPRSAFEEQTGIPLASLTHACDPQGEPVALTRATMRVGGLYNWKGQPERLTYLGFNWSGNGHWHQFALTEKPGVVWSEVLDDQLRSFEETAATRADEPSAKPATFVLTAHQLAQAMELADGVTRTIAGDDAETPIALAYLPARKSTDGDDMAAGLYAWLHDYPEEGATGPLDEVPADAAEPVKPTSTPGAPVGGVRLTAAQIEAGANEFGDGVDYWGGFSDGVEFAEREHGVTDTTPPQAEPGTWAQYVAGMVVAYLGGPIDDDRIKPIAGIIQRRLWALAAPQPAEHPDAPKFTTGHCTNNKVPGGCQLHNLQCGWPKCDQRAVAASAPAGGSAKP